MSEQEESSQINNQIQNASTPVDDKTESCISNESKVEIVSKTFDSNKNVEDSSITANETQEAKKPSNEGVSASPLPLNTPKTPLKEKPKINRKKDDDIEEFDTDEEEENHSSEESSNKPNYSDNIIYEGDKCMYVEPGTGRRLVWNSQENKWCAEDKSGPSADSADAMKNYEFDGKNYVYTCKTTNVTYKFIQEKNEWVVKDDKESESKSEETESGNTPSQPVSGAVYGFENDTHTYTDPSDGTSYFWDREKNAWFPKVDDDFMARYQMSYGFVDNSSTDTKTETKSPSKAPENQQNQKTSKSNKEEKKGEKRKVPDPPTWFDVDEAHNTTIYLSNLPLDITLEELKELVTKCGLLARDEKGKDKLKLYMDENGEAKGDARCTYIKIESVNLALDILDGWQLREKTISVQRAKFQMKGNYDPSLKPKKKKKDKEKQKKIHEKLFDWRPDRLRGEPLKCERVVIIKNLFKPEDFDKDVTLLLEYQQDVRSECIKCGEVKKVTVYDRHPEGVAQVTFKEVEEAQACIQLLNGRWFGQRKITAEIWDGKTKYKIKETEEQIEARINKWDKFLEEQEESEEKAKKEAETHSQTPSTEASNNT